MTRRAVPVYDLRTAMHSSTLDYHLVSESPAPLFMGELPRRWDDVPAGVVVNLCGPMYPLGDARGRVIHQLQLLDVLDPECLPSRGRIEGFLDAVHHHAAAEPTYWHCHAGLNRAGLAVAAYLHRYRGMRISHAIRHLRERRSPMVLCNAFFERVLREWYGGDDEQAFEPVAIDVWLGEREGRRLGP